MTQRILVTEVTTIAPLKRRKGFVSASQHLSFILHEKSSFFSLSQHCPQLISPRLQQRLSPARQYKMTQAGIYESQTQRMQKCQLSYTATSPMTTTPQFTIKLEIQWKRIVVGQNFYLLLWNIKLQRSLLVPFASFLSRLVWTHLLKPLQQPQHISRA